MKRAVTPVPKSIPLENPLEMSPFFSAGRKVSEPLSSSESPRPPAPSTRAFCSPSRHLTSNPFQSISLKPATPQAQFCILPSQSPARCRGAPPQLLFQPQVPAPAPLRPCFQGASSRPLTWQQQDTGALGPVDIPNLAAEPEACAEPRTEAQGAVDPGPHGAGGDRVGGVAGAPLQQRLPQPPAQRGGGLGSGGAAAVQTLVLPGAGGSQQLWGVCGERGDGSAAPLPAQDPGDLPPGATIPPLTAHREMHGHLEGAQQVESFADEFACMLHLYPRQL